MFDNEGVNQLVAFPPSPFFFGGMFSSSTSALPFCFRFASAMFLAKKQKKKSGRDTIFGRYFLKINLGLKIQF